MKQYSLILFNRSLIMKQLLAEIIKEWKTSSLPKIINRDINLYEFCQLPVKKIIAVTGFRRVGKTYCLLDFSQKIKKENCIYINFDDERLPKTPDLLTELTEVVTELYGSNSRYFLMDEIQNIPQWSLWLRRMNDSTNYKLIVSGSSSKLLSSELSTELRGKSLSLKLEPLNFKEFLTFKGISGKMINDLPHPNLLNLTREYLIYGGFPEITLVEEAKKNMILDEYYKTFLANDIIEKHKIRNKETIKALILLLLSSPNFTISKLSHTLKSLGYEASKATVMRYLEFLRESYFYNETEFHSPNLKNRLKAARKPCFIDNIFLSRYSSRFSNNTRRLMENLVGNYLKRKFENNVYYWKNYQNKEVDFVIQNKEMTKELIQVTYASSLNEIEAREEKSIISAKRELKPKKMTIITWDYEDTRNKISFIPLHQWLLR